MAEKDMRLSKMQSSKLGLPGLKMDRYTLVKLGLLAGLGIILLVVGQMGKRSPTANPIPDLGAAGSPKPVGSIIPRSIGTAIGSFFVPGKRSRSGISSVKLEGQSGYLRYKQARRDTKY